MSKLQKDIMFICLAFMSLLIFAKLIERYHHYSGPNLTLYGLLLVAMVTITTMFFCYLLWVRLKGVTLIVVSDHYTSIDTENMRESSNHALLTEQSRIEIVPKVALEQDSLKIRAHLQQQKGSWFYPPKILINLNINNLLLDNEAQVVVFKANLNRVLEQLKHWRTHQEIDLMINSMHSLDGFKEFKEIADHPMRFNLKSNLCQQLLELQNNTQSLLQHAPSGFLHYLKFARTLPNFIAKVDDLLAHLLLSEEGSKTQVYFSTSAKFNSDS